MTSKPLMSLEPWTPEQEQANEAVLALIALVAIPYGTVEEWLVAVYE